MEYIFAVKEFELLNININKHHLKRYIIFMLSMRDDAYEYSEKHHILPKSIFPQYRLKSKAGWNQIRISARAHYIAHLMLMRALPDCSSMVHAFWRMCNKNVADKRHYNVSSRLYEMTKKAHSTIMKTIHNDPVLKSKKSNAIKKYRSDPKVKEAYSISRLGEKNPMFGMTGEKNHFFGKTHSNETKSRITKSRIGNLNPRFGVKLTNEQKEILSIANKGKRLYCSIITGVLKKENPNNYIPEKDFFPWSNCWGFSDPYLRNKYPKELRGKWSSQ